MRWKQKLWTVMQCMALYGGSVLHTDWLREIYCSFLQPVACIPPQRNEVIDFLHSTKDQFSSVFFHACLHSSVRIEKIFWFLVVYVLYTSSPFLWQFIFKFFNLFSSSFTTICFLQCCHIFEVLTTKPISVFPSFSSHVLCDMFPDLLFLSSYWSSSWVFPSIHMHSFHNASVFDHSHYLWSTYGKFIVLMAWKGCTALLDSVCGNVKCIIFFPFFLSLSLSLFFNMEIYSFPFFMMDLLIPVSVCLKNLGYVNYVHSKWNSKVFTDYVSARLNDFSNYKDHRMELTYYPVLTCRTHTIHILLGWAGLQKLYKYSIPWRIPNIINN